MGATFYSQILHTWNWPGIASDLQDAIAAYREACALREPGDPYPEVIKTRNAVAARGDDGKTVESSEFLGSVMTFAPSGRFYAPWSDVPGRVLSRDAAWFEALERVANKFGLAVEQGEGDPTDMYACMYDDLDPLGRAPHENAMADEGAR
jgi:hypothetical protein